MATINVTLELEEGLWADIRFLALSKKLSPQNFVAAMMHNALDAEERACLEQADRDIEEGNFVEHDEMLRRLEVLREKANKAA